MQDINANSLVASRRQEAEPPGPELAWSGESSHLDTPQNLIDTTFKVRLPDCDNPIRDFSMLRCRGRLLIGEEAKDAWWLHEDQNPH